MPDADRDTIFFDFGSKERAMYAVHEVRRDNRELRYCDTVPSESCAKVEVHDELLGSVITDDMDRPSVQIVGGLPMMVFNVSVAPTQVSFCDVFIATPTTAGNLTSWQARPLPAFSRSNRKEDDPALSPDGSFVLAEVATATKASDIWVTYWNSSTESFGDPSPLGGLTSPKYEDGPEIYQISADRFEVYFGGEHNTLSRIMRSVCTR